MSWTNFQDDFLRIYNKPDQYMPEIWHRKLERVKVGTWFFGLLPIYEYRYTPWEKLAIPNTTTNTVDSKANQRIRATTTRTNRGCTAMKIEEQTTPVSTYEIHTPKMYVAVYYYKNSQTPFAFTSDSKEQLLQSMKNFNSSTSFDESKPVKIFTLNC